MRRASALVMLGLMAAACATPRVNVDPDGNVDVDVEPVGQGGEMWEGTLQGTPAFASVSGSAMVDARNDTSYVSVQIRGVPAAAAGTHPWHVHRGKCGSNGEIVGPPTAYPPLRPGSDGAASARAVLPMALNEAEDYYINVHASPTDLGTIVACGAIDD